MTQSDSRFLIETPPYCPTVECYQHGNGAEHHVEGCPLAETFYGTSHSLSHAVQGIADAMRPYVDELTAEMRKTWRGRLTLLLLRIRALR